MPPCITGAQLPVDTRPRAALGCPPVSRNTTRLLRCCWIARILAASVGAGCAACTHPKGDPAKSETRLALARDFLAQNPPNYEAASSEVEKAIAYLPTNEEAYNIRGIINF